MAGTTHISIDDADLSAAVPMPANVKQIGGTALAFGQGAMAASIPVTIASNQTNVAVTQSGSGYSVQATITRPANTTAYTANDVLGGAITFSTVGPSGGVLLLDSIELEADISAVPAGMTSFNLYLYSVTPPSAIADNAAFDIPSGDRASFLGKFAAGTPVDEGSTLYVRTNNIIGQFKLASANVFGYLVTVGGFTPAANSEVYKVTLHTRAL